jgi:hypothetical protein
LAASTFWLIILRTITLFCFQTNSPIPTSSSLPQSIFSTWSRRKLTGAWESYDCLVGSNSHLRGTSAKNSNYTLPNRYASRETDGVTPGITDLAALHWWFLK